MTWEEAKDDIEVYQNVMKKFSTWNKIEFKQVLLDENNSKSKLLSIITETCEYAVKVGSYEISIFYTGSAQKGTGNWATYDKKQINLEEVAQSIAKSGYKNDV